MLEKVRNFLLNREWALVIGIVTTLVTSSEEFLEWLSIVASEQNDWTPLGLLPLVAAVITRFRVSSNSTIEDVKNQLA